MDKSAEGWVIKVILKIPSGQAARPRARFSCRALNEASYSYLRHSTGFLVAIFQVCQLTVKRDIITVIIPASVNIHQLRLIL